MCRKIRQQNKPKQQTVGKGFIQTGRMFVICNKLPLQSFYVKKDKYMKKIFVAVCLVALALTSTSCASRRSGCPNSWDGYKYRG